MSVVPAAQQAAQAQQARASQSIGLIDSVFGSPARAAQRTDFLNALRAHLSDTTNFNYANQARQTKFATARAGLTGGSIDASRQQLGIRSLLGQRAADEGQVQEAGQTLAGQDQAERQSLIDAAMGGATMGSSAIRSSLTQQLGLQNALKAWAPSTLMGAGSDFATAYRNYQNQNSFNQGYNAGGWS